jgi:hypothetical protein
VSTADDNCDADKDDAVSSQLLTLEIAQRAHYMLHDGRLIIPWSAFQLDECDNALLRRKTQVINVLKTSRHDAPTMTAF